MVLGQRQWGMDPLHLQLANSTLRHVIKRLHFPLEVMLVCVRWYAAYPLSLRNLEEMMAERGVAVDHATVHRWALKILPVLAGVFRRRKRAVGASWRIDETYILVGGQWKYLYRAVDRMGHTVDFLLTARRDKAAARRFFEQAINLHDVPKRGITIDNSYLNMAAVQCLIADEGLVVVLRQSKYLNNMVKQYHRDFKRRVRSMGGQDITYGPTTDHGCRDHAHDEEGADESPQQVKHVGSARVLQLSHLT